MNPFELLMKVFSRKVEKFRLWEIHFTHVYEFILVHKIHVPYCLVFIMSVPILSNILVLPIYHLAKKCPKINSKYCDIFDRMNLYGKIFGFLLAFVWSHFSGCKNSKGFSTLTFTQDNICPMNFKWRHTALIVPILAGVTGRIFIP